MPKALYLTIETAGCPTACMHCGQRGRDYGFMPVEHVVRLLDLASSYCRKGGLKLHAYPMHEVLAHPKAPDVIRLFREHLPESWSLEPLPTTGMPLATRDDWRDLLAAAESVGTTTCWLAFHGMDEVHDRTVNLDGAYRAACLAVERILSAGLKCGCNVFLSKANLHQVESLMETLPSLGVDQASYEVHNYFPTARTRRHESLRPELADLLPIAAGVRQATCFKKEHWEDLEACTEGSYVRKALSPDGNDSVRWELPPSLGSVRLVCRPNLDVHSGDAGLYGPLHGNLGSDDPEQVLKRGVDSGDIPGERIFFDADAIPTVSELAHEVGDSQATHVHFQPWSMRWRWLDRALADCRRL